MYLKKRRENVTLHFKVMTCFEVTELLELIDKDFVAAFTTIPIDIKENISEMTE